MVANSDLHVLTRQTDNPNTTVQGGRTWQLNKGHIVVKIDTVIARVSYNSYSVDSLLRPFSEWINIFVLVQASTIK